MNLFIPVTAALGLLFVLQYGTILKRPREWAASKHPLLRELLGCSMCCGFWTGVFAGIAWQLHGGVFDPSAILAFGFSISFLGNLFDLLFKWLDLQIYNSDK